MPQANYAHTLHLLNLRTSIREPVSCKPQSPCALEPTQAGRSLCPQRKPHMLQLRSNAAKQIHILKKTTPTPSHNPKSGDVHGAMAGKCVQARAVCLPSLPTGIWASGRSCSHNSHFSLQPYHLAVNLSSEQIFPPRSPVIQLSG